MNSLPDRDKFFGETKRDIERALPCLFSYMGNGIYFSFC